MSTTDPARWSFTGNARGVSFAAAFRSGRSRALARLSATIGILLVAGSALAQDFPTVVYTTAHGLTHDVVTRVLRDPRGFLWVGGTSDLARFDGERFVRYGLSEGLDVGTGVNHLLTAPDGNLWIATNGGGIFRFDLTTTDPARRLTRFRVGDDRATNRVNVVEFAADGRLWAGTDAGVFVGAPQQELHRITLPLTSGMQNDRVMAVTLVSRGQSMWVATTHAVYRCAIERIECRIVSPRGVRWLAFGPDERPWLVRADGIEVLENDDGGSTHTIGAQWTPRRAVRGSDGMLVIGDDRRIIWTDGRSERLLSASTALSRVNDILEDQTGNLWMAANEGLVGIRRQGITLFPQPQLRAPQLLTLARQRNGRPYAWSEEEWLHRIDGPAVTSAHLVRPPAMGRSLWKDRSVRIDSLGDVWLGTGVGLLRYSSPRFSGSAPPEVAPIASYTTADGLAGNHIGDIFEDSRGDIWIANVPAGAETLTVWRRRTSQFEKLGVAFGLPPASQLGTFVEDSRGAVWAALREGGLVRLTATGAEVFGTERGLPPLITAMAAGPDGSLWIGGSDRVLKIEDVARKDLRATPILTGLGAGVLSLARTPSGVLFVGTFAGLVIFDPSSKSTRTLSSFEGLPRGAVQALVPDSDGSILIVAGRTVGRVWPMPTANEDLPPRCLLSAVRVGGRAWPVPERGFDRLDGVSLGAAANQIDVELLGLSPRLGEPLQYEYRLSGLSRAWTRTSDHRVSFVGLASGRYTLEARVLGTNGTSASPVAAVTFRVLPPWYRSWWFLALSTLAIVAAALSAHRGRVAQVRRTERLRSRIATDLHDDIGSSLSQIAILAEVARRRAKPGDAAVSEPLTSIATTARDLVDAMSDIVWAVNPKTDSLADLTRRMHRFAEETLGAADIALTFSAPHDIHLKLGADLRRELYLILKESVNNIARHSGSSAARVDLALLGGELRLVITDDGHGFDPSRDGDGNGIPSMRKRASSFGGKLRIDSGPGEGTRVTLVANLRGARG